MLHGEADPTTGPDSCADKVPGELLEPVDLAKQADLRSAAVADALTAMLAAVGQPEAPQEV